MKTSPQLSVFSISFLWWETDTHIHDSNLSNTYTVRFSKIYAKFGCMTDIKLQRLSAKIISTDIQYPINIKTK